MVTGSSEIITITLDGLTVSGSPGTTILELARESGIEIPTLCSDPNLAPVGACRICLVQDERNGNLYAACVTPISPGMVINTGTDVVLEHRRNIVELLLSSHPDTCMVCDKGNRCQLRQIASDLGIGLSRLYRTPHSSITQELNPYIERDLTKCIMCGKCIRACQERVVEGAIDYYQRGFSAKPATFNDLPLEYSECTFCGTCVPLCPTGALSEKLKTYRGSTGTSIETICPFCACGCLLAIETKESSIVRVKPGKGKSINTGTACIWGSYSVDFIHSQDRLAKPLIKKDGNFLESSWEAALELVSKRFIEIKEKNGPESFAVSVSPNCTNEDAYVLQRFARNIIGTNNIDSFSYHTPFNTESDNTLRSGNLFHIEDIENADLIFIINADPENTAPVVSYAIKRAVRFKKAKLLTLHPMETKLSNFSDIWLRPVIGTETALLNGIVRQMLNNSDDSRKSASGKIINFQQFIDSLNDSPLSRTSKITGLTSELIREVSELVSASNNLVIISDIETNLNTDNKLFQATENLVLLVNNMNKGCCSHLNLQHFCNSLGIRDMGVSPNYLPGYQSITDADIRNKFNTVWDRVLPAGKGKGIIEILSGSDNKAVDLKCLYIMGENPVITLPSAMNIDSLFNSLDFLVVQDMFLTETAKIADVVLPVASFAEKDGTFTNLEGRIQKLNRVFNPLGDSLPDWEIAVRLSHKLANGMPYKSTREILKEIDTLVPLYRGVQEILKTQNRSIDTFNIRNTCLIAEEKAPIRFVLTKYEYEWDKDYEYPYRLIRSVNSRYFGTGTRTNRSTRFIDRASDEFLIEINEHEANALSLQTEDYVNLKSQYSELPARVRINNMVPDRTIFAANIPADHNHILSKLLILRNSSSNMEKPIIQNVYINISKAV